MSWSRRQALRGAAATLWLPLLPSVLAREARAAAEAPPRRLVIWFLPHGMQHVHVAPSGSQFETTTVTEPLTMLPGRFSLVTHLDNPNGVGSHPNATSSLLTDVAADYNTLEGGISVDQVAAQHSSSTAPFPSLQLATEVPGLFGSSFGTLSSRVSWASSSVPLAPTTTPRAAFDLLFQGDDAALSEAEAARRQALRHSVLDAVKERIHSLDAKLSAGDRIRLDQYTTGIRELERRIDGLADAECDPGPVPGLDPTYTEAVGAMADLQQVALTCDLTRVITFMYGPSASDITLPELGIARGSHQLSHAWAYDDEANDEFQAMNRWHVERYARFCRDLADQPQPDDSDLLESTAVVLASEFSNAATHATDQLAMAVAGGEASGMRPGRHVDAGGRPHANLLRALLGHMGVPSNGFGPNATGVLSL